MTDTVVQVVASKTVSIIYYRPTSFNECNASAGQASGSIVDDTKGLIMTNRHVVSSGPFVGRCIFHNFEECDIERAHRDPIHDFALVWFDPKKIKRMAISALQLKPDIAHVGMKVTVIGNDAGQKLSVLSGVISRLDCNAPQYEGWHDFNTNYIQAATLAKGGSSGSPVVDANGDVVALQAGAFAGSAATNFYLPLARVKRALDCIREGKPVSRGEIQVEWGLKSFDQCRKLGLSNTWEEVLGLKFPEETCMLVAEHVIPKGPADSKVREGDILIKVNDEALTRFVDLESILDDNVGSKISLLLLRWGKECTVEVEVSNLDTLIPDRFVSACGARFHDVSLPQALQYSIPCGDAGVIVSESTGSFGKGWLIEEIDHRETPNLRALSKILETLNDRSRVLVKYKELSDLNHVYTQGVDIDRHWYPEMKLVSRNDKTGRWDLTNLAETLPPIAPKPQKANLGVSVSALYPQAKDIIRSFMCVDFSTPVPLDGCHGHAFKGYGLVLDAEYGLLLCSRSAVPHHLGDIKLTLAKTIFVEARIVYMDLNYGVVILKYDPSLVLADVYTPSLSDKYFEKGEKAVYIGITEQGDPTFGKTSISDILTWSPPNTTSKPQYRVTNMDTIVTESTLPRHYPSGVLMTKDGTVQALCLTFSGEDDEEIISSIPTAPLLPVLDLLKKGIEPKLNALNFEVFAIEMTKAKLEGVPDKWIDRIENEGQGRYTLLQIEKIAAGGDKQFEEMDIILTLNGELVTNPWKLSMLNHSNEVDVLVIRNQKETNIHWRRIQTEDFETNHVIKFGGATIQQPHNAVRQQVRELPSKVYISQISDGSPAHSYDVCSTWFVTHINDTSTPDLSSFLREVAKVSDGDHLKIDFRTLKGIHEIRTMKKDDHYFPTVEYKKSMKQNGWDIINWGGKQATEEHGEPTQDC
ncbi:nuclear serine protease HtrA2/Nma111 [Zopfia rhizophila CBS 207.26]|uniref:Pro-apoptotic serine protease NMA111 n=1 Tax=Zopfia rhizophila CBS 207.26 TaxID=1314779 RepID=A0A6A6EVD6_9PEZI|nr:nuclear serine protease HtrA2/Nma111 [Zopfia rhizophila CBS 207.26]